MTSWIRIYTNIVIIPWYLQYIPRNMHTVFALLCFVVVIHWLIFPYPSGLLHWHCGNLTIAPVPAKQPWWIWINTSCEFIMNDCITTTKQSTTKPCAYFLGYTVYTYVQEVQWWDHPVSLWRCPLTCNPEKCYLLTCSLGIYNLKRGLRYSHLLTRHCPCNLLPEPTSPIHEYAGQIWGHPVTSLMMSSPWKILFGGIISDCLFISEVKLMLCFIFQNFQNGCHFEVATNIFNGCNTRNNIPVR